MHWSPLTILGAVLIAASVIFMPWIFTTAIASDYRQGRLRKEDIGKLDKIQPGEEGVGTFCFLVCVGAFPFYIVFKFNFLLSILCGLPCSAAISLAAFYLWATFVRVVVWWVDKRQGQK